MSNTDCTFLKEKCEKLHGLLGSQWEQNYFIKNRNLELEDKVDDLRAQVAELTRQLEEFKNNTIDDLK